MTVLNESWVINLRSSEKKMKVVETFYTLSATELKRLCKKYAMKGFAKDDANSEFEITFNQDIFNAIGASRIAPLVFEATVSQDG